MDDLEQAIASFITFVRVTIRTEFTSIWLPIQLGTIAMAAIVAVAIAAILRRNFDLVSATMGWPAYLRMAVRTIAANLGVITFVLILLVANAAISTTVEHPRIYLIGVAISLGSAWVAISIAAGFIRNELINRIVAVTAWTIAALSILRLLDPVSASLDSIAITLGGLRISLLLVLKTTVLLLLAIWAALAVSNFIDRRVQSFADLSPSFQVLIGKLVRIAFLTLAVVVVVSSVGIDLSVLAFFTGAVGVGIGFGLQKIVSNLVSGIILLADKSIKPGDMISVGDQFGWVTSMTARYISVDTRTGCEHLIPNEDFVSQKVVSWSYSDNRMMLESKFGVGYDSNPHRVQELAIAAAASVERVATDPAPVCHFLNFGESSLDFSLRYWIAEPSGGMINVRTAVLLALWDTFKREGIEIPFPQRDLNARTPVRVIVERGEAA